MKARKRLSHYDLFGKYLEREQKQREKVDRAVVKLLRASNALGNVRYEHQVLKQALKRTSAAIEDYEKAPTPEKLYPPAKDPKKKKGRVIEL